MSAIEIAAGRLRLVLQALDEVLAWVEALPDDVHAEVSPDWLARVRATAPGDPWSLSFAMVEATTGVAVGVCAFKGPADADGGVEAAYGVDEPYQGLGYATDAVRALTRFAFASGRGRLVRGHTRPGNTASARVLAKGGFRRVGQVVDPEDGLVDRWERSDAPTAAVADPAQE